MKGTADAILTYHRPAAETWGLGGPDYDRVSFYISDALSHAAQRLNAQPGEHVLDVATGTGWTARNVAAFGAHVTAVDIAAELLVAAETLSAHVRPPIDFRFGDAENLPLENAAFDRVISTFGVMFATHQEVAARELARVCKPGGRLVMTTWVPGGAVADFFALIGGYADSPPPDPSPLAWGDPRHVRNLLEQDFELTFESGMNHSYNDNPDDIWQLYSAAFGPIRQVLAQLDPQRAAAFRRDMNAYHQGYETADHLIHIKREYLLIIGRRR